MKKLLYSECIFLMKEAFWIVHVLRALAGACNTWHNPQGLLDARSVSLRAPVQDAAVIYEDVLSEASSVATVLFGF